MIIAAPQTALMRIGMLSRNMSTMNYLFAPESVAERQTIFRELGKATGPISRLEMFPAYMSSLFPLSKEEFRRVLRDPGVPRPD